MADTEHMIWYEPWVTFDDGVQTEIGRIEDSDQRIGFAFHNYRKVDDDYAKVWVNAYTHFDESNPMPRRSRSSSRHRHPKRNAARSCDRAASWFAW
jgi:hypothetical protein